jgi:ferredoxin
MQMAFNILELKLGCQEQFHFENFAISSGNVYEGSFTINIAGYSDIVYEGVSNIFMALENQDYPINGDCRIGQCGLCKMKLKKGEVKLNGLSLLKHNVLPKSSYPVFVCQKRILKLPEINLASTAFTSECCYRSLENQR